MAHFSACSRGLQTREIEYDLTLSASPLPSSSTNPDFTLISIPSLPAVAHPNVESDPFHYGPHRVVTRWFNTIVLGAS